jgi:hypothetical protein
MIDHDRLFKELITTFFWEFIPEMAAYLEPDSITFLDKELFTDIKSLRSNSKFKIISILHFEF